MSEGRRSRLGHRLTAVAGEAIGELVAQCMKMQHVGGGIFELGRRQHFGGPVGGLLLLGNIDLQQFLQIVFSPCRSV